MLNKRPQMDHMGFQVEGETVRFSRNGGLSGSNPESLVACRGTNSELLNHITPQFLISFLLETTLARLFRSSLQLLSSFHVPVVTSVLHFLYVIWLPFRQDQQEVMGR
jgi:hypothetical protein